ncbi:uncharacterized protein LOC110844976 isoform X2 [Folsomia candida]|uniref:uncharacterized protein LOC110844976 isoform X2 n=1 Tax=Folsomia candida TaxID=158441 RepID=UPI000B8F05BC|nr:uncharacterized protein LOC110844976 isoform X2 [Folsomia candida]
MKMDQAEMTKAKLAVVGGGSPILRLDKNGGMFRIPISDKWALAGTTQVKFRSTRTTLCVLGLLLTLIVTGVVLNCRIHNLEAKNVALEGELRTVNLKLTCLMAKMSGNDDTSRICSEWENELRLSPVVDQYYANEEKDDNAQKSGRRVPRSVGNDADSSFKNMNLTSASHHRKRERGTAVTKSEILKQFRNLKDLREKDQIDLTKLKIKLESAKIRAKTAKSLLTAYRASARDQNRNAGNTSDARAVYLTVRDTAINIQNPKQLIGPWHMAETGSNLGFNDLWYRNLALDYNGTSVVFQENGLYLIYAQVYYKSTQTKKDKISPMGFKIYLKKNTKTSQMFKQPIPIAECVPAFPKTFYQTCFTQICWFIEEGDQVYLEHFTEAFPVIEAEKMGQTFLGIVRLSH